MPTLDQRKINEAYPNTSNSKSLRSVSAECLNTSADRTMLMGVIHYISFSLVGQEVLVIFSLYFSEDQEL